jgi:hypothetical protein
MIYSLGGFEEEIVKKFYVPPVLKVLGIADPNDGNTMSHDPNSRGAAYLMLTDHPNSTPCSLSRDDWNIMNFTHGTKILGEDGKAH